MTMNLVMMGTGDFAVPTFAALYHTPHRVAGLFTQPDRTGSGHHRSLQNPMKQLAVGHATPIFQPERVNLLEALADLRSLQPDLLVVAAYGQILSPELLGIPRLGTINVHASLLPKYRGAAPVAYAILNGDLESGVSIIQVLPQLDAGPILAVARTPIDRQETAGALEDRLAHLAVGLIPEVIEQFASGKLHPLPQNESLVTRAPKIKKPMGEIDWARRADQIDCHVRAMQPWPNPFTFLHSPGKPPQRLLVLEVQSVPDAASATTPGTPINLDKNRLIIQSGKGAVEILQIQPEGKRRMSATEFLRGRPVSAGDRFGPALP